MVWQAGGMQAWGSLYVMYVMVMVMGMVTGRQRWYGQVNVSK